MRLELGVGCGAPKLAHKQASQPGLAFIEPKSGSLKGASMVWQGADC